MRARGLDAEFRATGQTGIFISGRGVGDRRRGGGLHLGRGRMDLRPADRPDHWDLIEGQGSLFHPSFAGVSLGLLHGAQPDAVDRLPRADPHHDAGREHAAARRSGRSSTSRSQLGRLTNPAIRAPASPSTPRRSARRRRATLLAALEAEHGLPAIDPVRIGVDGARRPPRRGVPGNRQLIRAPNREDRDAHEPPPHRRRERWPIAGAFTIARGSAPRPRWWSPRSRDGRRGAAAASACPMPATARRSRASLAQIEAARRDRGRRSTGRACRRCSRPARRATRSTARLGPRGQARPAAGLELAGLPAPRARSKTCLHPQPRHAGEPWREAARGAAGRPLLKLKSAARGDLDADRGGARGARRRPALIVDANEALDAETT